MNPIAPSTPVENLRDDLSAQVESSYVTCPADLGEYEVFTAVFGTFAASGQGDYIHFTEPVSGTKFAVWLDKDDNGTAPSGALYVASNTKIEVDIATGDTASQVGQKVKAAIALVAGMDEFTVSGAGATLTFTANKVGNPTDAVAKKNDDSTAGSVVVTVTTAGVASNNNSKYITLRSGSNAAFYAWFNVNSQGSDPAPGGTGIPVAITKGSNAAQVAAALAAAIDANSNFEAEVESGAIVKVTNSASGSATDMTAGNSGCTVAVRHQGHAASGPSPDTAVSSLTNF